MTEPITMGLPGSKGYYELCEVPIENLLEAVNGMIKSLNLADGIATCLRWEILVLVIREREMSRRDLITKNTPLDKAHDIVKLS